MVKANCSLDKNFIHLSYQPHSSKA